MAAAGRIGLARDLARSELSAAPGSTPSAEARAVRQICACTVPPQPSCRYHLPWPRAVPGVQGLRAVLGLQGPRPACFALHRLPQEPAAVAAEEAPTLQEIQRAISHRYTSHSCGRRAGSASVSRV